MNGGTWLRRLRLASCNGRFPLPPLVAEERRTRIERFAVGELPVPELSLLVEEAVREEHVSGAVALRDLGADADAGLGRAGGRVDVAYVQTDDLGRAEAGAEGEAEGEVVSRVGGGHGEQAGLLGAGQGLVG